MAPLSPDWRKELTRVLADKRVSQPPPASFIDVVIGPFMGFMGWALLGVFGPLVLGLIGSSLFDVKWSTWLGTLLALVGFGVTIVLPIFCMIKALGCFMRTMRGATVMRLGRNPTCLIQGARQPPVLYLRSFGLDAAATRPPTFREAFGPNYSKHFKTFESVEATIVGVLQRHGPVIAIGKPNEPVPPPGAARFYVNDEHWKSVVEEIVPFCQLVIWVTGHTAGLRWELQHLKQTVSPERLVLWLHMHIEHFTPQERRAEWDLFVSAFRDLFQKALPADIEQVRFIAFAEDWSPILIPGQQFRPSWFESLISQNCVLGLRGFLSQRRW